MPWTRSPSPHSQIHSRKPGDGPRSTYPGRVSDVFEDREGNMWFATNVGAVRYDGTHYRTFTSEDGLGDNRIATTRQTREWETVGLDRRITDEIRTITQTPDGALWFGALGGRITRMLADSVHTYTVNDGLAGGLIWFRSLKPSGDRGLWAGFRPYRGLGAGGLSRFDGRKWSVVETPTDTLAVVSLTEATDGSPLDCHRRAGPATLSWRRMDRIRSGAGPAGSQLRSGHPSVGWVGLGHHFGWAGHRPAQG